ncbi:MAG TPA: GFA family protein [Alphaproteobacteria bacterium]|nr:GFA family protein [Alphaproteobacteria bacterium]
MNLESPEEGAARKRPGQRVVGRCLCGAVELEIEFPAFWAWHDHSAASRRAHGAAYATYIGCWRKHIRVAKGRRSIARFEDTKTKSTRSFCSRCGTPLLYERKRSPHMVNIPRALFTGRTGREPRYHVAIEELQDWAYTGKRLVPLKGYPGVVWERPKSRKRPRDVDILEFLDRQDLAARVRVDR